MTTTPTAFADFYVTYLAAHRHPANRALHLFAKVAMIAQLGIAAVEHSVLALLAAPLLGILPCWIGHWLFERNGAAALTYPSSSVVGSLLTLVSG
jgi:hypothetical protein